MDRRYSQARFYNGAPASSRGQRRREVLVRQHLERARRASHQGQSFGGSTGGQASVDGPGGGGVQRSRGDVVRAARQIFRDQGSGDLGARASMAQLRGYGSAGDTLNRPSSVATPIAPS